MTFVGLHFSLIRDEDLIRVRHEGKVVEGGSNLRLNYGLMPPLPMLTLQDPAANGSSCIRHPLSDPPCSSCRPMCSALAQSLRPRHVRDSSDAGFAHTSLLRLLCRPG